MWGHFNEFRCCEKRVGNEILIPYYSDYRHDVQYQTFDIKEYLSKSNKIVIELGNGWYKGFFGLEGKDKNFGSKFQTIAEIRIHYTDKSEEAISTDDSWLYYGSDTENSDIYHGEIINYLLWDGKENPKKKPVEGGVERKLEERYSLLLVGSVVEFLYRNVAGLRATEPGFNKALIAPCVNSTLLFFKCSYESAHGLYRVGWEIAKDGNVHFVIEVPIDCTAVVELPFYPKNEKVELDSGVYNFDYKPTKDVRTKYTTKSLFYYMLDDERAMNIIQKILHPLYHILKSGDVDPMYENLESLKDTP